MRICGGTFWTKASSQWVLWEPLTCSLVVGHTALPSGHILRRRRWTRLRCNQSASRKSSSFLLSCDSWCCLLLSTTRAFPEHNLPWKQSSQLLHCAQCLQSSISLQRNVFCSTFLPPVLSSRTGAAESVCRGDPCPGISSSRRKKDKDPSGG